ncbi:MAG: hypothetical protein EPN97_11450 [Alphaproteobacteria bacterium]|nr:MAG: hypothetical protein EPN97_11450 [Alphaproteobacteria bacterium]
MAGSGTPKNQDATTAGVGSSFLNKQQGEDAKIEKARREGIRNALLEETRKKFLEAPPAASGYSRQLQVLENGVNEYLKRNPSYNSRVVVLKPDEFDVAMALGMSSKDAVQQMLKRQGIEPDAPMLAGIAAHMNYGYDTKFGLSGYTQDAETQPNVGAAKVSVIVPNSNHADPNPVPGLSHRDNVEFFNRHETWHVKDSWYDMSRFSPKAQAGALEWNAVTLGAGAEAREAFSTQMRKEALGDVGALGDMIRENKKTTAIIDNVIAYRQADPFDVLHLSSPVLEGLKSEIDRMGVEKFRKMDEKNVREFYHTVVEKYGVSANAVKKAADCEVSGDDGMRAKLASSPDPDSKKAAQLLKLKNADPAQEDSDIPLTPAQEKIKAELDRYNPARALENRAFTDGGKITPETLIDAYGKLTEELRQKTLKFPDSELYPLEMTKLQQTFVDMVRHTDYVAMNRRHGHEVEADLPAALQSRFAAPVAPVATAEAAPKEEAVTVTGKKTVPKPL